MYEENFYQIPMNENVHEVINDNDKYQKSMEKNPRAKREIKAANGDKPVNTNGKYAHLDIKKKSGSSTLKTLANKEIYKIKEKLEQK